MPDRQRRRDSRIRDRADDRRLNHNRFGTVFLPLLFLYPISLIFLLIIVF
jgi:cell division septal protein FtsQ